jgi:predicted Zn-dependent protease
MTCTKQGLGERLHSLLMQEYGFKERDFAHERVDRAMASLNIARESKEPIISEVLWMSPPIAFTLPGRYCYISRRFIERCASDAPVAFALAHEIGHHDLGHLGPAESWAAEVIELAPVRLAVQLLYRLSSWVYSRDMEFRADEYALELCHKAGFDLRQCLRCFDILTQYMLDNHNLDEVYGTDEELEVEPQPANNTFDRLYIEAHLWLARHRRSHPAISERRRALLSQIGGTKPS